jgi:glycosyltransferase involved in cell wall biosynthesis
MIAPPRLLIVQNGEYFGGAEKSLLCFLEELDTANSVLLLAFRHYDYHKLFTNQGFKFVYPNRSLLAFAEFIARKIRHGWMAREMACNLFILWILFINRIKNVHINMHFNRGEVHLITIRWLAKHITYHGRSLIEQYAIPQGAIKRSDTIICVSQHVRGQYVQAYPNYAAKFIVIYDGVYEKRRRQFLEKPDFLVFLAPAVLEPRKGIDIAVRAFEAFVADTNDSKTRLVIAGGDSPAHPDYAVALRQLCGNSTVRHQISLLGHVEDMRPLYAMANVVLMLSRDGEALGRVGIEAQMMSCLLIGHVVGAVSEYLDPGLTGYSSGGNDTLEVAQLMIRAYREWATTLPIRRRAFENAYNLFSTEDSYSAMKKLLFMGL